jgi:cytidylate kinase
VLAAVAYKAVCISSEDGAGAADTAQLVATRLGFRLIDEDIVTRAAVEAGVDKEVVADVERRKSLVTRLVEGMGPASMAAGYVVIDGSYGQPASDELRGMIQSVIEDTATAGNVVIVAHAASLALAERGEVLRVHVTASPDTRRGRLAASLQLDENEAARLIKRSDAGRADYIKRFYGIGAERPTHYDLVINTDKLTSEDAARLIVDAATGAASPEAA